MGGASDGVDAVSWSPDLELAALVTSQPALLLITAEFEPVAELPLFSEEFGDSEWEIFPVDVVGFACGRGYTQGYGVS